MNERSEIESLRELLKEQIKLKTLFQSRLIGIVNNLEQYKKDKTKNNWDMLLGALDNVKKMFKEIQRG